MSQAREPGHVRLRFRFFTVSGRVAPALCLAAIPFAFGSLRSGGYGKRLFLGIVFALGFWVLQQVFTRLAGIYHFDFRIAYAMPPAIMLGVSLWLFKRRSG